MRFRLALGRAPSAQEAAMSLARLCRSAAQAALQDFCHAIFNLNEFVYVP